MQFRILGPLEVIADGRPLALGRRKQRAVLAILLVHANRVVGLDRLVEELWGHEPRLRPSARCRPTCPISVASWNPTARPARLPACC